MQLGAYLNTSSYHISTAALWHYSLSSISSYGPRFWISRSFIAIDHAITGYETRCYGLRGCQLETEIELDLNGG